jgi:MATE family multidrug resistance protein
MTLALFPALITLWYTEEILIFAGQNESVSRMSAEFIHGSVFGIVPLYLSLCSSAFLRSIKRPRIVLFANILGAIVHAGPCIVLVNYYGWGLRGAGIASALNSWTRFLFLEIYLQKNRPLGGAEWTPDSLAWNGLKDYIKLAIPSAAIYCTESWSFELQAVIAGWVSTSGLAAHVAGVSVICIAFRIPQGLSQSLSTLVGTALGNGRPRQAKLFANYGFGVGILLALGSGACIHVYRSSIGAVYSKDPEVVPLMDTVIDMASVFVIPDALSMTQEGILRGLKLQSLTARYKILSLFGVMLPSSFILSRYMGVPGVWTGSILGVCFSTFFYYRIITSTDFAQRSTEAIKDNQ